MNKNEEEHHYSGTGTRLLLAVIAPVMADSPKKIPVTLSTSSVVTDETGADKVINPNGIVHIWGAIRTANAKLTIGVAPNTQVFTGTVRVDLDHIIFPTCQQQCITINL